MPSLSRRSLLKYFGAAAATLPIASHLRFGRAAEGSAPVRLVLFPSMNGAAPEYFWPSPGNLSAMSVVTEPLAPYQSQMTFVRGLDIEGSFNHFAIRSMFTGAPVSDYLSPDPTVPSVDQVIANHFQSTSPSAMRSLHLGAIPADSIDFYQLYGRSTFFFNPNPVHYEANPVTAFDQIFSGLSDGGGGDTGPNFEDDVLAINTAELGDLRARADASPRERAKLSQHGDALAALGTGGVTPPVSCDASPLASVEKLRPALQGNAAAAYQYSLFSDLMDAQLDIIARALVCGVTRVATLQAGSADGNAIVPVDGGYPHHNTSHGDPATFSRVQRWYAEKLARLCAALNVPDPLDPAGNTVLHNSCIVWLSECMPQSHGSEDVPAFFIGSAGGRLSTGGFVEAPGATNKTLMKTLCQALGVPGADSSHFGSTVLGEVLA